MKRIRHISLKESLSLPLRSAHYYLLKASSGLKDRSVRYLFQILLIGACQMMVFQKTIAQTAVVEVIPLSNKILVVHYNEGTINYAKGGQTFNGGDVVVLTNAALNTSAATTLSNYSLSSSNDGNYASAKNPSVINRKSKPTNLTNSSSNSPAQTSEHWIYMTLPTNLVSGKNYTLTINNSVATQSSFAFSFDEKTIYSEAIHVNNLGYVPSAAAKFGYLYHWAGDAGSIDLSAFVGQPFQLINTSSNAVAFTGSIAFRKPKTTAETSQTGGPFAGETPNENFLGADVWECDFSTFSTAGSYRLVVPGMGSSYPFTLGSDIYRSAFNSVMKGILQNRSGISLTTANGAERDRPAPHNPNITPGLSGRVKYSSATSFKGEEIHGCKGASIVGNINTWGWYQDAGDWDGYPQHVVIPIDLTQIKQ